MAERDADAIKRDIAVARERLASTVDLLAARANPRDLAGRVRERAVGFVKKPVVRAALAGVAAVSVALVVYRVRTRRVDRMILKAMLAADKTSDKATEWPRLRAVS